MPPDQNVFKPPLFSTITSEHWKHALKQGRETKNSVSLRIKAKIADHFQRAQTMGAELKTACGPVVTAPYPAEPESID